MKASLPFGFTAAFIACAALFSGVSSRTKPKINPRRCGKNHPEDCLYLSDLDYPVGVIEGVSLTDPSRGNYEIELTIRFPIGAQSPCPVIIWHHGGNPSSRGDARSEEWSQLLAAAGYVLIHPARTMIADPTPYEVECRDNGFDTPEPCAYWMTQARFGPQNTHFIIDHLSDVEALDSALANLLDGTKIIVAGHSAGSTSVLANAGAWQQWKANTPRYQERNDTPIAFLASGVQGPMFADFKTGFQSTNAFSPRELSSYAGIDRPFMFITGVGDETGEPPEARTTGWLTSLPGNKYLVWDTNPEAVHETMDIHKCNTPVRESHCLWIGSAGLAFLDSVVRQRREATEWLDSKALQILSSGEIELHRR